LICGTNHSYLIFLNFKKGRFFICWISPKLHKLRSFAYILTYLKITMFKCQFLHLISFLL
jgi:hypothetical protein